MRERKRGQFGYQGLNRLVTCGICKRKTHSDLDGCVGLDLCRVCRLDCEWENAHSDYCSDDGCDPACKEAEKEYKVAKAARDRKEANRRYAVTGQ